MKLRPWAFIGMHISSQTLSKFLIAPKNPVNINANYMPRYDILGEVCDCRVAFITLKPISVTFCVLCQYFAR